MKLNCDLGESFGAWKMGLDDCVMPHIDMANIACGFHAGDSDVIASTLALAKQNTVEIGAHPSYPDKQGFGRRSMTLTAQELSNCLHYQIAAIEGMAKLQGLTLSYVKPHGALYNDMMKDENLLLTVIKAIASYSPKLKLMIPATMSRKIITGLLRNELNYKGVVITDALDMAGISHFFEPIEAVINTFSAGADIALMPIEIRSPKDLSALDELIARLVEEVDNNSLDATEIRESAQRILALKHQFKLSSTLNEPLAIEQAQQTLGRSTHRKIEEQLALSAITQAKNQNNVIPFTLKSNAHIHIIMPDTRNVCHINMGHNTIVKAHFPRTKAFT